MIESFKLTLMLLSFLKSCVSMSTYFTQFFETITLSDIEKSENVPPQGESFTPNYHLLNLTSSKCCYV